VFCQIFQLWRFRLVCLWKLILLFPPAKYDLNNSVVIERFCVEGSNKRSDRGHSSNDLEFFTDRTFRASFSAFRKLINAVPFFPRNSGRGGLTCRLAQGPGKRGAGGQCLRAALWWKEGIANGLSWSLPPPGSCSGSGGAALFDSPRGGTSPCRDPGLACGLASAKSGPSPLWQRDWLGTTSRAGHENRMIRIRVQPWPWPDEVRMRCGLYTSSN